MNTDRLAQFANQRYLNMETFRKTGQPVVTPLWFVEENGVLYVYSFATAGKVKRIRNNPNVRIVPSDMRGNPKGSWIDATARLVDEPNATHAHQLLSKKYGWMKKFGDAFSSVMKRRKVVIVIEPI